jgi:hypothetical protein
MLCYYRFVFTLVLSILTRLFLSEPNQITVCMFFLICLWFLGRYHRLLVVLFLYYKQINFIGYRILKTGSASVLDKNTLNQKIVYISTIKGDIASTLSIYMKYKILL